MAPLEAFKLAACRRASIASALIDYRTASVDKMQEAILAALDIDERGDRWAAEIVEMGTGKVSG